jgi:hypothetical protein
MVGVSCDHRRKAYQGDDVQRVKKTVLWTLLAFFVYAMVKSPSQAADIVHTVGDIIMQGLKSIGSFFDALLSNN